VERFDEYFDLIRRRRLAQENLRPGRRYIASLRITVPIEPLNLQVLPLLEIVEPYRTVFSMHLCSVASGVSHAGLDLKVDARDPFGTNAHFFWNSETICLRLLPWQKFCKLATQPIEIPFLIRLASGNAGVLNSSRQSSHPFGRTGCFTLSRCNSS
jgi:hypothetical protein